MEAKRMSLDAITKGPRRAPQRTVIYGVPKIGKSTWASHAPDVVWIPVEEGANALDVSSFPRVLTWGDMLDALDALTDGKHSYRTAVIDTLDVLEGIVWKRTCQTKLNGDKRVQSIEDYGFAKGYIFALDIWSELLARLDTLRDKRGMDIILVAHATLVTVKSPDTEDFQRYDLQLHHKAASLIRGWADHVLFATTQIGLHKQNQRMKVSSLGDRVLHTHSAPGWVAGTRSSAPAELPLSYAAWIEASSALETKEAVLARIEVAKAKVPAEKHASIEAAIAAALGGTDPVGRLRAVEGRLAMTNTKENGQ